MSTKIRLGTLDFNAIKGSLKAYLEDQSEFTDINFEGANMNTLLNLLAYNAHYQALAANFLANEMFLDTATKRGAIVSRAKELGYTPRSRVASKTDATIVFDGVINSPASVSIPAGAVFHATKDDVTRLFTTMVPYTATMVSAGKYSVGNVELYEGILTQNILMYYTSDPTVLIPNKEIDVTTMKVEVKSGSLDYVSYYKPASFLTVGDTTQFYVVQEGFDGYELYFGDGIMGVQPENGSPVRVTYLVTTGAAGNGSGGFAWMSVLPENVTTNTVITVNAENSSGGADIEADTSIKLNASNSFSTQNRCVTADDYVKMAALNFPEIKDVFGWDGIENSPPKFGKIILCAQPIVGDTLTLTQKDSIAVFLKRKGVGNVGVEFVDPEYVNIIIDTKIIYDPNLLTSTTYDLSYKIKAKVEEYAKSVIQRFKGSFRYSTLIREIDDTDYSIVSNLTSLKLTKRLNPSSYNKNNFKFSFENPITAGSLTSSAFFAGEPYEVFLSDDGLGVVGVYNLQGGRKNLIERVGTIDYTNGNVVISNLSVGSMNSTTLDMTVVPSTNDLSSYQNVILQVKLDDVTVTVDKA